MASGISVITPGSPNGKVVAQNVAVAGDPEFVQHVKAAPGGLDPVGTLQALAVAATAGGHALPSIPTDAEYALVSLETAPIRWNDDGATAPTATVGHLLTPPSSDSTYLMIEGRDRIVNWRGFRTTGVSGAVQVTYYKAVVPA
jgi:hypothetical protein